MFRKKSFSAVILAGGSSTRMGGVSKQQIKICGVPAVVHTLRAFENCPECREIVVVSIADECKLYRAYAEEYGLKKLKKTVFGGATRQESAFIGQKNVDASADYIAIHDAARCLITPEEISRVFREAVKYKCATACRRATDTVKLADKNNKTRTSGQPRREELFCMQTPQIFLADLYRAAAYTAAEEGFTATDDCSLLERAGFGCRLVECSPANIKITTPEDLIIAEALMKEREKTAEKKGE